MDERSNELLLQILAVQKEQATLLRQHLGRFKFSIRSLLLLTTLMCVGLGVDAYKMPSGGRVVFPAPSAYSSPAPTNPPLTYVPVLRPGQPYWTTPGTATDPSINMDAPVNSSVPVK